MKNKWKRIVIFAVLVGMIFLLQYPLKAVLGDKIISGSEQTYYGVVVDNAMSRVNNLRFSREYIGVQFEDGGGMLFYFADSCESDVAIGDYVQVKGAMEERGFPIALDIVILDKK